MSLVETLPGWHVVLAVHARELRHSVEDLLVANVVLGGRSAVAEPPRWCSKTYPALRTSVARMMGDLSRSEWRGGLRNGSRWRV